MHICLSAMCIDVRKQIAAPLDNGYTQIAAKDRACCTRKNVDNKWLVHMMQSLLLLAVSLMQAFEAESDKCPRKSRLRFIFLPFKPPAHVLVFIL